MWETTIEALKSPELWKTIIYLVLGAIIGAIVSVLYSLRAHRPKLLVTGGGEFGDREHRT